MNSDAAPETKAERWQSITTFRGLHQINMPVREEANRILAPGQACVLLARLKMKNSTAFA